MAYDLFLGQTNDDWSRDGRNGGRPSPGKDAAMGGLLLGIGFALAFVKGPQKKLDAEDQSEYDDYLAEDPVTTMEIPAFESTSDVIQKRLR